MAKILGVAVMAGFLAAFVREYPVSKDWGREMTRGKLIQSYEVIPAGYGISHYYVNKEAYRVHWIGIHLVVRGWMNLKAWIAMGSQNGLKIPVDVGEAWDLRHANDRLTQKNRKLQAENGFLRGVPVSSAVVS